MKLTADLCTAPGIPGKRAVMLCDETGEPLPNQVAVSLEQTVGEPSTITVTFRIDGDNIKLGDR